MEGGGGAGVPPGGGLSAAAALDRAHIDFMAEKARQSAIENPAATGFGEDTRKILERPGFNLSCHAPLLILVPPA